jgi:hypothetical protein
MDVAILTASVTNRGPHSESIWLVRRNSFYFSYYFKYMNLLHNHFCRFTFCFYILMAKQTNRRKRSVFNETHLQKIAFENWRTTKWCEKKRTDIGTMPWIRKKIKIGNKKNCAWQAISTLNEDPGLTRLFLGVVVFRHHVIIGIDMLSKWRHPSIVDRILKSISFPYPT